MTNGSPLGQAQGIGSPTIQPPNRQTTQLRLCYVAYSPLDLQSANSVQTFNTLRELSNLLRENLTAIVPRFGNEAPPPFPIRQLARIPINKISRIYQTARWSYLERAVYAERARRIIAPVKPALIYTRDLVCADRLVRANLPVLYEVHDLESQHPGQHKSARLVETLAHMDERTLRNSRGIVSLTETFRQEILARGWQPASRIFVIPDGYDDAVYFPRDKIEMRGALQLPQDTHIVTYAGLTFKYRGIAVLLRAFQKLKDANAILILIGGREFEVEEFQALARDLNMIERVQFIKRQSPNVLAEYLAASDVLVIPDTVTDATASPLKMFEYMAMARPIVCVERESLREILGGDTLYFPRGDVDEFASALGRAMQSDAQRLGERAHHRATGFTYKRRAEKIVHAAETLLLQG